MGPLVAVALAPVVAFPVPPTLFPARVKLAQVIRVALPKWTVIDLFPKKAPIPSTVAAKSSVYEAWKGSWVTLPCLPERSPT